MSDEMVLELLLFHRSRSHEQCLLNRTLFWYLIPIKRGCRISYSSLIFPSFITCSCCYEFAIVFAVILLFGCSS